MQTVAFNSVMSQITIEGGSVTSVQTLLRKIGYENSRLHPSDTDRSVVVSTQVKCVCSQLLCPLFPKYLIS